MSEYPLQVFCRFDSEAAEQLENWRRQQPRIPTLADAVRRLVRRGLAAERPEMEENAA